MIQLSSVTKSFGARVLLDDVTWQVSDRETVGLCGPNGAGKTTLLRIFANLDEPDSGAVVKPVRPARGLPAPGRPGPRGTHAARGSVARVRVAAGCSPGDAGDRGAPGRPGGARGRARGDAASLQRSAGPLPAARRVRDRPEDRHGAAGARVRPRRLRQADGDVLGRLADAHRAGEAAAGEAGPAPPRRADQPPRSRRPQLARGVPARLPARGHPRVARPLLPGRRRRSHHGHPPAHAGRLRLQLLAVPRPARRAPRAPARRQAAAGRGGGAHRDVHQPVPLLGHQGRAGAGPGQDARQSRAHRGAARAQARPLSLSDLREERADGVRPEETYARRTGPRASSTGLASTSSAATASRCSARTAPASPR